MRNIIVDTVLWLHSYYSQDHFVFVLYRTVTRRLSPSFFQSFINYMLNEIQQVAKQGYEWHGKIK